jgi:hypothetical protein
LRCWTKSYNEGNCLLNFQVCLKGGWTKSYNEGNCLLNFQVCLKGGICFEWGGGVQPESFRLTQPYIANCKGKCTVTVDAMTSQKAFSPIMCCNCKCICSLTYGPTHFLMRQFSHAQDAMEERGSLYLRSLYLCIAFCDVFVLLYWETELQCKLSFLLHSIIFYSWVCVCNVQLKWC